MQSNLKIVAAENDWEKYAAIYNRCMNFAPYSAPVSPGFIQRHVVPFMADCHSRALIASDGSGKEGIVHISHKSGANGDAAVLHLLLADANDVAEKLLAEAERWAQERSLTQIRSYSLFFNPYAFVQHGYEAYCWGGLYPARNAFHRRGWDLELDIVNMYLDLTCEPAVFDPGAEGAEWSDGGLCEDELQSSGRIEVRSRGGKVVAAGGYIYLKAVSAFLGKPVGQIWLHSEREVYGQGFGRMALTLCHRRLYEMGARKVILATNNALFRAIRLYCSLGYRQEPIHAFTFSRSLET